MNVFIFISQIISSPSVMMLMNTFTHFTEEHPADRGIHVMNSLEILATAFGIWNLDFFRMLYKPYCLHPNLSIIQVMCLDYAVATYPLLMIVSTYMFFELYERFKVVRVLLLIINGMHLPLL